MMLELCVFFLLSFFFTLFLCAPVLVKKWMNFIIPNYLLSHSSSHARTSLILPIEAVRKEKFQQKKNLNKNTEAYPCEIHLEIYSLSRPIKPRFNKKTFFSAIWFGMMQKKSFDPREKERKLCRIRKFLMII
jgi:hypothetical protein